MKKAIAISTLLLTAIAQTTTVDAKPANTETNVGVASGALIGAAAGGPIGFILGAAFGGLLGDEVHKANQVDDLKAQLTHASNVEQKLTQEMNQLKQELALTESNQNLTGSEMLQMDVLFHTNVTGVDDNDHKRIKELATFLTRYPALAVKLDGFADPRGSTEQNQTLSEQRISTVKEILVQQGIDEERIFVAAHGEQSSVAPEGNLDAYALERRVSIRFFPEQSEDTTLASNQ